MENEIWYRNRNQNIGYFTDGVFQTCKMKNVNGKTENGKWQM